MQIGYVRVSTNDQNTDLQRQALERAGCEQVFEEKMSGTVANRPALKKLLRTLNAGDTLVVWKLDRLGRSMRNLVLLVDELRQRGIHFKSLTDSIDTSDISEVSAVSEDFDHFEVDSFLNCMGKDNLLKLHETLVHVYGMKQGQTIYKTIKDKSYSFTPEKLTRKKKVERFTGIIFAHSDINDPGNFVDFLEKNKNKTKNLNGIRSAITKSYGETDGLKYYSLFKPYFKIISALK